MNELIKSIDGAIAVLAKPNALQEAETTLLASIKRALLICYFELNMAVPNDADILVLVNKILDSILEKYTSIRADEIATAFANGIRKQYGEYYGLCLISFEQFIEGYLNSPERKEQAKNHYKSLETKSEPTEDEKFTIAKHLCIDALMVIKNSGVPVKTAATVYDFLNGLQLIDPDYKKGIMPLALNALVKQKEGEADNCMVLTKRRQLKMEVEQLKQNIAADGITEEQYKETKRIAKRLILVDWMRDIITNETDLGELIEVKRNK